MLLRPKDLVELEGNGGVPFAECMRALVSAECRALGIPIPKIEWDSRVTVRDGGIDLRLLTGASTPGQLIPSSPSIWSFKSGEDGRKPATFCKEVEKPSHDEIRSALKRGETYVWCSPRDCDPKLRQKFRDEAKRLATQLRIDPSQFTFLWADHVQEWLLQRLDVLAQFLPRAFEGIRGAMPLRIYLARREAHEHGHPWSELSDRTGLKLQIQEHLKGKGSSTVLHIAGLSGIGKTRLVLQACLEEPTLSKAALVVPSWREAPHRLLDRLHENPAPAVLIIDEMPLEEFDAFRRWLESTGGKVRAVSVGPAPRSKTRYLRDGDIRILGEPSSDTDLQQILRSAHASLAEDVVRSIVSHSGHDIRLALMLADASVRHDSWRAQPVTGMREVWNRLTASLPSAEEASIARAFDLLSVAIDVGHAGAYESELKHLAAFGKFKKPRLLELMSKAADHGLGVKTPQFFECSPRALATWAFYERLWPRLQHELDQVMGDKAPGRLRKRFIERCQDLPDSMREEVIGLVSTTFLRKLSAPDLGRLASADSSREFQRWCELDPGPGLSWLRAAIDSASPQELNALHGSPDAEGRWAGRRQVVWLCEHLACFKEHFWDCEHILFQLSAVETEPALGNNSTATWKALFLPVLSFTEVPFPDRWTRLLKRLATADQDSLPRILSAAMGVIAPPGGRIVPPPIVGGRLVPDEWRPSSQEELLQIRKQSAVDLLRGAQDLLPFLKPVAQTALSKQLPLLLRLGVGDEVMRFFSGELDPETRRQLIVTLDDLVEQAANPETAERPRGRWLTADVADQLRRWRSHLTPADLIDIVKDQTSREAWRHFRPSKSGEVHESSELQSSVQALLGEPQRLQELEKWFGSTECKSAFLYARLLGEADISSATEQVVLEWMFKPGLQDFCAGYLRGTMIRRGETDARWNEAVQQLATEDLPGALLIALRADLPEPALEPLLARLEKVRDEQLGVLGLLGYPRSGPDLSPAARAAILRSLHRRASKPSLGMGIHLASAWLGGEKTPPPSELLTAAADLLESDLSMGGAASAFDWWTLVSAMAGRVPQLAARCIARFLSTRHDETFDRRDYAMKLADEIAESAPRELMGALGDAMLDSSRGLLFYLVSLKGIFDKIGLEHVRPWLDKHGQKAAKAIARHLSSPRCDESDRLLVPELTHSVMSAYQGDVGVWREFLAGRHSWEVRGPAAETAASVRSEMQRFLGHDEEWVRRWAKAELDMLKADLELDERWDDEDRRR